MGTACRDCKNLLLVGDMKDRKTGSPIWHQMKCLAQPQPSEFDPYTGKMEDKKEYGFCRDLNDGNCPEFRRK